MPHLTLEYSGNLSQEVDYQQLFSDLHHVLADVGGIHIENCKSRAVRRDTYYIGRGEPENAFVHLTVQIMAGRSPELKGAMGRALMEVLQCSYASSGEEHPLQITIELRDLAQGGYFKAT